jgi:hypothetical protein
MSNVLYYGTLTGTMHKDHEPTVNLDRDFARQYETIMRDARERPGENVTVPFNFKRMIDGVIHRVGGNN